MSWTNYHSHCHYCDGKMPPEDHIMEAIRQNIKIFGFSSHCPVPFQNSWSIKLENFQAYLSEIDGLKEKFAGQIELYKSLEVDFIPDVISIHSDLIKNANLNYTVGSVHFVGQFENSDWWEIDGTTTRFKEGLSSIYHDDIQQVVKDYFSNIRKMVQEACPEIIGHLDKIKMHNGKEYFFDENDDWYQKELLATLEEIKSSHAIIEVNTRGMYKKYTTEPYPGKIALHAINKLGIPVCINSDSHHPSEITKCFPETAGLLQTIGFKNLRIFRNKEWVDVGFNSAGLDF